MVKRVAEAVVIVACVLGGAWLSILLTWANRLDDTAFYE